MARAVSRQVLCQQNHAGAGRQHRQSLPDFLLQRREHAQLMQQLALHRAFAAGQHHAVQRLLQIRQLAQLDALSAQLCQRVYMLDKRTLQC